MAQNRKPKNTKLTREQRIEICRLYQYRLLALQEAGAYTIENLAVRYGCAKNTIWSLLRFMEVDDLVLGEDKITQTVRVLDDQIESLKKENDSLKRRVFSLETEKTGIIEKLRRFVFSLS